MSAGIERRGWLGDKRRGALVFIVVAGLVVGGLGWVTAAALDLESDQWLARARAEQTEQVRLAQRDREQQLQAQRKQADEDFAQVQEEFAAKVRLALWRLDSRFAPLLAREDTRPYSHFSALYAPPVVLDSKGTLCEAAAVLEPSPLLNAELPDWMLLHFQTSIEAGWGSPQVLPAPSRQRLFSCKIDLGNVTVPREQLLRTLRQGKVARELLDLVRREEYRLEVALADGASREPPEQLVVQSPITRGKTLPGNKEDDQQENMRKNPGKTAPYSAADKGKDGFRGSSYTNNDFAYNSRLTQRGQGGPQPQQAPYGENAQAVNFNTTSNGLTTSTAQQVQAWTRQQAASERVLVSVGPMVPVWLPVQTPEDKLVVARLVRVRSPEIESWTLLSGWPHPGQPVCFALATLYKVREPLVPREVCQGIVLDWPRLRKMLVDEVQDLLPQARVLPMRADTPTHPERTMTTLPVELDPGQGPVRQPERQAVEPAEPEAAAVPLEVPELGWTPLRLGLGLSWAAAMVALSAVGLGGWSLIDLSQRRIRFVSAVTHELRTPLTTLRLYLDMLTGGLVKEPKQQEEYLHTLNAETDRLNRLVSNVLDFSRLEDQRPRLQMVEVSLAGLLEQLRDTWEARCHDAGKELILENAVGEDALFTTDAQLVQQILANLIDNACKYSRGAEDRRVWVKARAGERGRLWLEVEDHGPGVTSTEQRSIFRPFRRGRGADVTAGGVGLGLALARRWTSLLGGTLSLHPGADGSGVCFRLELPAASNP